MATRWRLLLKAMETSVEHSDAIVHAIASRLEAGLRQPKVEQLPSCSVLYNFLSLHFNNMRLNVRTWETLFRAATNAASRGLSSTRERLGCLFLGVGVRNTALACAAPRDAGCTATPSVIFAPPSELDVVVPTLSERSLSGSYSVFQTESAGIWRTGAPCRG